MNTITQLLDLGSSSSGGGRSQGGSDASLFADTLGQHMNWSGGGSAADKAAAVVKSSDKPAEKAVQKDIQKSEGKPDDDSKSAAKAKGVHASDASHGVHGAKTRKTDDNKDKDDKDKDDKDKDKKRLEVSGTAQDVDPTGNDLPGLPQAATERQAPPEDAAEEALSQLARRPVPAETKSAVIASRMEASCKADEGQDEGEAFSQRLLDGLQEKMSGQGADAARAATGAAGGGQAANAAALAKDLASSVQGTSSATTAGATGTATTSTTAVAQAPAAANSANATANLSIPMSMRQQGWDQALGQRMMWMARQGVQEARLQVNPRHLGPVDIKLSVHHDQASVSFVAHNPATRHALEAAMPRLREMMGEQGLNLAQSDVSGHSPGQQQQQAANDGSGSGRGDGAAKGALGNGDAGAVEGTGGSDAVSLQTAVDYYA